MIGILCLKDGDPDITMMIQDEDETMFTFSTIEKAREFAREHIICRISVVLFIDLVNFEVIEF